jgi:hypothetical protein
MCSGLHEPLANRTVLGSCSPSWVNPFAVIEPLSVASCQNWITIGRWVIAAGALAQGRAIVANDFENCHICEINEAPKTQD